MHSYEIKNKYDKTIKDYLKYHYIPVPYHWNNNDMTIFDKVCYGEIP